jgi:hypothetical protein
MSANEVAVTIRTAEGEIVSFFMPADLVRQSPQPAIPVEVIDRSGEYGVVALPRRTIEGSNAVKVLTGALSFA